MRTYANLAPSRRSIWALASRQPGAVVAALALSLLTVAASAQTTFDYNLQPRTFRACRLLLPYQTGGIWTVQASDDRSLIFEGMRRYPDKPAGWDIVNPLAPPSATTGNPDKPVLPSTPVAELPTGSRGYWEVVLDSNPQSAPASTAAFNPNYNGPQLENYDLIYIWAGGHDSGNNDVEINLFRPEWRAALLRAVYNGAVLWIDQKRDNNGTVVTQFIPPGTVLDLPPPAAGTAVPFTFAPGGTTGGAIRRVVANGTAYTYGRDRMLSYPFLLSDIADVPYLGRYPNVFGDPTANPATTDSITLNDYGWQRVVDVVAGANSYRNIVVTRCGAGAIVLTAGDVGYDVVDWWYGLHQNRPYGQQAPDCKLAWNILALAGASLQGQGTAAGQAASVTPTPPPLGINWQYPDRFDRTTILGPVVSSPVVNKGMAYVMASGTQGRLMCFDVEPSSDLDGDGNADDGLTDYSLGRPYDLVWSVDMGTDWTPRTAGPAVGTVYLPGGPLTDAVFVSLVDASPGANSYGEVRAYNAHTGALLWTRRLMPYDTNGRVIDLSTPTVYRNWLCVLASEWNPNVHSSGGVESAYGRAHCFNTNYAWAPASTNSQQWVYPQPTTDPAGDGDTSRPEPGKSMPPFQDPLWIWQLTQNNAPLLPPFPTPKPVLIPPTGPLANTGVDFYLQASAPLSLTYNSTTNQMDNDTAAGGTDWLLIPTPTMPNLPRTDYLNKRAFRVLLPAASIDPQDNVARVDDATITAALDPSNWTDPGTGNTYAWMCSAYAREYLVPSATAGKVRDPMLLGLGRPIQLNLTPSGSLAGWLPGPVARISKSAANQRRVGSAALLNGKEAVVTDTVEDNSGVLRNFDYSTAYSGGPGRIICRDVDSGTPNWEYRPHRALPDSGTRAQLAKGGSAVERGNDTLFAAVTSTANPVAGDTRVRVPQVLGLNLAPRLEVRLAGASEAEVRAGAALVVTTIGADGTSERTVPATLTTTTGTTRTIYQLDPTSRTLLFTAAEAGWVDDTVGSLWGKPIWVDYHRTDPAQPAETGADTTVTHELHVLPDILRAQYSPGIVRLQHGMIGVTGTGALFAITLANGVPVTQGATGLNEATFSGQTAGLPVGWTGVMPRGLLDVRSLQLPSGELVLPGTEINVRYTYYDELSGQAVETIERLQVPVNFGGAKGPMMLADRTVHVGTEGYRPDGMRGVPNLLQSPDPDGGLAFAATRKSLLSVLIDPITRLVRGALSQPAIPEASYPASSTPVVGGAAAVDAGGLIVGSHLMTMLDRPIPNPTAYAGEGVGFVSRMKTERTLVCDNTRLVEVVAGKPSWVCVGSSAPEPHEALNVGLGNQDVKITPFSRPAKALYLSNGNILVADTGNDRVIEINRQGRQVWPLDGPSGTYPGGYDFYTSNYNNILDLERPSDCFRYYVEYRAGLASRTSVNGDLLPLSRPTPTNPATWTGTEMHTVIADPGKNRVIEVVTWVDSLRRQTHRVDVLTPAAVRVAAGKGPQKIAYTKALPIFDPQSGTPGAVIGYLCAAANLHQLMVVERGTRLVNPAANRTPSGASTAWSWLSWLYGDNVNSLNPLIFRNLKDVELSYEGTQVFVTVTCGQFAGRLSSIAANVPPHELSRQGAGIFEYCLQYGGGGWTRVAATDSNGGDSFAVSPDDPIWWFTRANYLYNSFNYLTGDANYLYGGTLSRRTISNLRYADVDGSIHWLDMPWNPVSAIRLPTDRRPVGTQRAVQHLVTNAVPLTQNLSRDNVRSAVSDAVGPANLFSSVMVVGSNDNYNASPDDDVHSLDRRETIPDPQQTDWMDPFNQPTFADRR